MPHAEQSASSSAGSARDGVPGTVYLLCFGEHGRPVTGNRVARHYLGWTEAGVDDRLAAHLAGVGSPLVAAVVRDGGTVRLVRTWSDVDRHFERRLKRRAEATRLCPACVQAGRARGRRLIDTEEPSELHNVDA